LARLVLHISYAVSLQYYIHAHDAQASTPVVVFCVGCGFGTEKFTLRMLLNMIVVAVGIAIASKGRWNIMTSEMVLLSKALPLLQGNSCLILLVQSFNVPAFSVSLRV
jgi:hypothetical protein